MLLRVSVLLINVRFFQLKTLLRSPKESEQLATEAAEREDVDLKKPDVIAVKLPRPKQAC